MRELNGDAEMKEFFNDIETKGSGNTTYFINNFCFYRTKGCLLWG
jgi:hypothetical protein